MFLDEAAQEPTAPSIAHTPPEPRKLSSAERMLAQRMRESRYIHLVDALRESIYTKVWQPHDRIPSEHRLMEAFDMSRGTVRRAIKVLVDEGLLVQHQGSGTYVAEAGIAHPAGIRPLSFAESLREQGKRFTTKVIEQQICTPPADVARELGLPEDTKVGYLQRVRVVLGKPATCQESWLNLEACPGLMDADFTKESLFDAVERCAGKKITTSHMRYFARQAGLEHGRLLACEETAPMLVLEQNISLEDGRSIEWSTTWFKPGQSVVGIASQGDMPVRDSSV